jgi:hypothetical protein
MPTGLTQHKQTGAKNKNNLTEQTPWPFATFRPKPATGNFLPFFSN